VEVINYCKNHKCSSNAQCINRLSDYICDCKNGYSGKTCATPPGSAKKDDIRAEVALAAKEVATIHHIQNKVMEASGPTGILWRPGQLNKPYKKPKEKTKANVAVGAEDKGHRISRISRLFVFAFLIIIVSFGIYFYNTQKENMIYHGREYSTLLAKDDDSSWW